jgi:hypothetical protein
MLSAHIYTFVRLLVSWTALLAILSTPRSAFAAETHVSDFVQAKDKVEYFEVYHIAHIDVDYRAPTALRDLISQRLRAQDYVRISAENFRAIDELYAALRNTAVDRKKACEFIGGPLDVRWGIVINYVDHTREAVGFGNLFDCVQLLSAPKAWRSSGNLLRYVERTFPFMK